MPSQFEKTQNPQRVLVVDDNADAAHMLGVILEVMGHNVRAVMDPKTAIPLAKALPPSVFILDIGMPGLDGYELGRELKKDHPKAIYIAHSAWKRDAAREAEVGFSFDYFLQKPMNLEECLQLLEVVQPER
jgi:CheY-like chemotaxis protein